MGPLCAMPPLLLLLLLELLHEAGQGPPVPPSPRAWPQPWGAPSPGAGRVWSQVTVPQQLGASTEGVAGLKQEAVSYMLRIDGRLYTIYLQQHAFLSDDFQTYMSSEKGSLHPAAAHVEPLSAAAQSPKYLTVYVVLDKALYNYMGSDPNTATQKIIQAFNLINNMFNPLNVTIVLSSLELWAEEDKISTAGDIHDLLQRFLQWKQLSLEPQAYNIASLLGYRERGAFLGTAAPGQACQRDAAATVALYHGNVTLESFSVLLAQLLGHSLGMSLDSPWGCSCPGRVCTMSPEALHFSGAKAFSNCSIRAFETFLKQGRGACLFQSPRLQRPSRQSGAVCGNRVVEPGEQCDCGTAQECLQDKCCTDKCRLKPKTKCASGLCCKNCQFRRRNSLCRPAADSTCDLPEVCSGSSASCPPDVYLQDGQDCGRGTGYCYQGRCQSSDLQCKHFYGRDSKNAPVGCYEEINGQRDRFGHCGFKDGHKSRSCAWRDLRCGKLICTYPSSKPFSSAAAAVIYAQVRQDLCVSLNYLNVPAWQDPLLVPPGTKCGSGRLCINYTCQPLSVLGSSCDSKTKCNGHGVCNNKGSCHCHPGWQLPDCRRRGWRRASGLEGGLQRALEDGEMAWLVLGSSLVLLVLTAALGLGLWRQQVLGHCSGERPGTAGQDMDRELEPDLELNLQADPELQIDPELDLALYLEADPELELETDRELNLEADPELQIDPDPDPDLVLNLEADPELNLQADPELALELQTDPDPEPDLELNLGEDPELALELQSDPEADPELEMKRAMDPTPEPALGQHHGH
ncbi:disintegrin and metalloproteinase domain-containing protein 32-like isoform X2 [Oenanthe melanoleuca]|uniref:disintegrin and metalloproteinase domain-containing protein 32-like isoform X2 n=1 Tax=Oenanthe melanoleuca TaxID=2939378 RepID=UPI0024C16B16|nr:disintegrin and metalloproteinase domain-containing protein 32-like isoform X2 [Oenanthe melanoleuca]